MTTLALLAVLGIVPVFLGLRVIRKAGRSPPVRLVLCMHNADGYFNLFAQGSVMKRISSSVSHFIISIAALTAAGLSAAVDGAIAVASSDPNVLLVTPQGDGAYHVAVTGVGHANLSVSGDADLGDGVRQITQVFEFEVYDGASEADHFDLAISDVVYAEALPAEAPDAPVTDLPEENESSVS
jgi:hypothetical protein